MTFLNHNGGVFRKSPADFKSGSEIDLLQCE